MKNIAVLLFVSFLLTNCDDEPAETTGCSTPATLRNLSLDGCGYVFELNDGTFLEPFRTIICLTPPLPKEVTEDPLFNFQFEDGKKVLLDYVDVEGRASACMAGKIVKITCIKEVEVSNTDR